MELDRDEIHQVRGSIGPSPSILPNYIIMKIIREAEEGYGGSHWRNHKKKFDKMNARGRYSISLNGEIQRWRCTLCGARNSTIGVFSEECFRCEAENEEKYYTYPKPSKDTPGYVSDYDSEEEWEGLGVMRHLSRVRVEGRPSNGLRS